jgi:hypothetical protein
MRRRVRRVIKKRFSKANAQNNLKRRAIRILGRSAKKMIAAASGAFSPDIGDKFIRLLALAPHVVRPPQRRRRAGLHSIPENPVSKFVLRHANIAAFEALEAGRIKPLATRAEAARRGSTTTHHKYRWAQFIKSLSRAVDSSRSFDGRFYYRLDNNVIVLRFPASARE